MGCRVLFLTALAVGLGSLAYAPPAAALSDYQVRSITQHLDHADCQPSAKVFDGKKIVGPPSDFPAATQWYRRFNKKLGNAIRGFKMLSSRDRKDPVAKKLQKKLFDRQEYGKRVFAALEKAEPVYKAWAAKTRATAAKNAAASQASKEKMRAACVHFSKVALKSEAHNQDGARIMRQWQHQNSYLSSAESMTKHRAIIDRIAAECAKPIAQDLPPKGQCNRAYRQPQRDPRTWCEAVKDADKIMAGFARGYAAQQVQHLTSGSIKHDTVAKRDGWLPIERAVRYVDMVGLSEAEKARLKERLGPVLKAAGLPTEPILDPKMQSEVDAYKAEIKASIDKGAAGFKTPKGKKHYSGKLAAKRVKKRLGKGAKPIKHVLKKKWTVKTKRMRNVRTGRIRYFPDYRYASGYVLTKVAGDEWCQLRQFTVYEYTKGASKKFRKAKKVTLGYVRFQKCK